MSFNSKSSRTQVRPQPGRVPTALRQQDPLLACIIKTITNHAEGAKKMKRRMAVPQCGQQRPVFQQIGVVDREGHPRHLPEEPRNRSWCRLCWVACR